MSRPTISQTSTLTAIYIHYTYIYVYMCNPIDCIICIYTFVYRYGYIGYTRYTAGNTYY